MAISADVLDAPGRPVTPAELIRDVVPDQPVILVGPVRPITGNSSELITEIPHP